MSKGQQVVLFQTDRGVSVSVYVPDVGGVDVEVHSYQAERQCWVCRAAADSYVSDDRFSMNERFADRYDAATEAVSMLFDLTKRFTPVAHRELFGEAKRTPETVLRALLKAYQDAHIEAAKVFSMQGEKRCCCTWTSSRSPCAKILTALFLTQCT